MSLRAAVRRQKLLLRAGIEALESRTMLSESAPPIAGPWTQVMNENFQSLNSNIWTNGEFWWDLNATYDGAYEPGQVSVNNGVLSLTATKQTTVAQDGTTKDFASGMIQSGGIQGLSTPGFAFTYGYLDVSMQAAPGSGVWSAVWMLPVSHQDDHSEIDVVEDLASQPDQYSAGFHNSPTTDVAHAQIDTSSNLQAGFHDYGVDWEPGSVTFYMDGVETTSYSGPDVPKVAMYAILNMDCQNSDWTGGVANALPSSTMQVNSIQVWQHTPNYTYGAQWTPPVNQFSDPSFENSQIGNLTPVAYYPNTFDWRYDGESGLVANDSSFGQANAPDGDQAAFVQGITGDDEGSVTQTVDVSTAGNYTISLAAAEGPNFGSTPIAVSVDGSVVDTITPGSTSYQNYSTPQFALSAGNHTFAFTATTLTSPESDSFIDTVSLNAIVPPTGVSATATTTGVDLQWTAAPGAVGYNVYRGNSSGGELSIPLQSGVTGTAFSDLTATANTDYYYYVTALYNSVSAPNDESVPSSEVSAEVVQTQVQPPGPPSGLMASNQTATGLTLTWNAPAVTADVSGYNVLRNGNSVGSVAGDLLSFPDTNLSPNTSYSYTVTAYDAAGNISAPSTALIATTTPDTTPPSAPTGLTASGQTATSLTLGWKASTDDVGVTGYNILSGGKSLGSVAATALSFPVTNLNPSTSDSYTVTAYDAAGNISAPSTALIATTTADTTPPSAPTGLAASRQTATSLTLSWKASTDDVGVTGYNILSGGKSLGSVAATVLSFPVTNLNPSTSDSYTVTAYDAAGNISAPSTALIATTTADTTPPSAPTGLTASGQTATSLTLSWKASTDDVGVTGYNILSGGKSLGSVAATALSFPVTNLGPNSSNSYTVTAFDAAGNTSAPSTALIATTTADTTPPSAPTGLTASGQTATSLTLSWKASTDDVGVSGYNILSNGKSLGSVAGTVLSFPVTNLNPSTSYSYTVTAFDAAGNISAASTALIATTTADTTPPSAPTGLAASGQTATGLTLSWKASTDNIGVTGYNILRNGVKVGSVAGTILTYPDTNLSPSTSYSYTVAAFDAAGNISTPSAAISSKTTADTTPPTAPTGLTASAVTATTITLTWKASTDNVGVTGYNVLRSGVVVGSVAGNVLTYTSAGRSPSTNYSYTVTAVDAAGNTSVPGSALSVTTTADTTPPTAPTGLATSAQTSSTITLTWNASTDNVGVTGYNILRSGVKVGSVAGTVLTYTDSKLSSSTTYSYTVTAFDAAGNTSPASTALSAKTAATVATPPTVPTGLTATAETATTVTLAWKASTDSAGVAGYNIMLNGVKVGSVSGTTLTYTSIGLSPLTSYSYTVSAYDSAGNTSAASAALSAKTTADTTPPTPPASLAAGAVTSTSVTLIWKASTDNVGVTGYNILRSGVKVASVAGNVLTYTSTGRSPSTAYTYTVTAFDAAGNTSAASNLLNVTTVAA